MPQKMMMRLELKHFHRFFVLLSAMERNQQIEKQTAFLQSTMRTDFDAGKVNTALKARWGIA